MSGRCFHFMGLLPIIRTSSIQKGFKYIEDICFFEVNAKYISSSELKISEFSRVRSTSENFDVFNMPKKNKFSFYFIQYTGIFLFTKQAVKMRKPKIFENTNNFGTTLFLTF